MTADELRAHVWDHAPVEYPHHIYGDRAKQVYWDSDFPACRAGGPHHAICLLNPGHPGDHFGNGYDDFGPLGATHWRQR